MKKIEMMARIKRALRFDVPLAVPLIAISLTCSASPRLRPVSFSTADGRTEAPSGVPQFPTLFAAYPVRPPWMVTGIDYPAGLPAGTALKDPATISMSGVSIDAGNHMVYVSGNGVVLDSYDFSLAGGWGIYVTGADDVIIRCNFKVGANNLVPINGSSAASHLTVQHTSIDGGGQGVVGNAGAIWALINFNGNTLAVEQSWMHYAPVDAIDFNGGGTLIVRHNLFDHLGYVTGAHADSVQYTRGNVTRSIINFNTVYFPQPVGGWPVVGGEGLQVEAQLGGQLHDVSLQNNTVIATGPMHVAGYLLAVRQDSGSILDGLDAQNNYMDVTGSWGPFYPPSGTHLSYVNNIDLTTGSVFPPPQGTRDSNVTGVLADAAAVAPGRPLILSLGLNEVADVVGHPSLQLNTGGIATYAGGSGSTHLTFHYSPALSDRLVTDLQVTGVSLPRGTAVTDRAADAVNLSGAAGPIRNASASSPNRPVGFTNGAFP